MAEKVRVPVIAAIMPVMMMGTIASAQTLDVGSDRQLFVDRYVIEQQRDVVLKLHEPVKQPLADSPLPPRFYMTVLKDEDESGVLYRAYWRGVDPSYDGPTHSGHPGEVYRYAESRDGHEWEMPNLGMHEIAGTRENNVVLANMPPFLHNFSPFIDTRPGIDPSERYKALAGYPGSGNKHQLRGDELKDRGLHAFVSTDGFHWKRRGEVIPYQEGWQSCVRLAERGVLVGG
jgi:hypothetical protein